MINGITEKPLRLTHNKNKGDREMSAEEILEHIKNTWETYGEIECPSLTSQQLGNVDDFLADLENLIADR